MFYFPPISGQAFSFDIFARNPSLPPPTHPTPPNHTQQSSIFELAPTLYFLYNFCTRIFSLNLCGGGGQALGGNQRHASRCCCFLSNHKIVLIDWAVLCVCLAQHIFSFSLSFSPSVCLSLSLSLFLSIYLSFYLSVCLSIYLSPYLFLRAVFFF